MIVLLKQRRTKWHINALAVLIICFLLVVSPAYAEASNTGWDVALTSIDQLHDSLTSLELANKQDKQSIQARVSKTMKSLRKLMRK